MTGVQMLSLALGASVSYGASMTVLVIRQLRREGRRHSFVEQYPTARRIPSPTDPTSSPQLAAGESPSEAAVNPAAASQRFHPAMGFRRHSER